MSKKPSKAESANLILKLYDVRREATMREARKWIVTFFPENAGDIAQAMIDPETSGYYRMITTYWDMAASFVNHGAIDEKMFLDASSECLVVFAKIEPFLAEVREIMQTPNYLENLETLMMKLPDAKETLAARRELMKRWMKARGEMNKSEQN